MKYKLPVVVSPLGEEGEGFMARCESLKATATGDTCEEAVKNLREAINDLVLEYGEAVVFRGINPDARIQILEVAV